MRNCKKKYSLGGFEPKFDKKKFGLDPKALMDALSNLPGVTGAMGANVPTTTVPNAKTPSVGDFASGVGSAMAGDPSALLGAAFAMGSDALMAPSRQRQRNEDAALLAKNLRPKAREEEDILNNIPLLFKKGGSNQLDPNPNAEIEKGEVYSKPNGDIRKLSDQAPTHEQGGVEVEVEKVLENTSTEKKFKWLAIDGKTHAKKFDETAKKIDEIEEKYERSTKLLKLSSRDLLTANAAQLNLDQQALIPTKQEVFDDLFNHQEQLKYQYNQSQTQFKEGGEPPKKKFVPIMPQPFTTQADGTAIQKPMDIKAVDAANKADADRQALARTPTLSAGKQQSSYSRKKREEYTEQEAAKARMKNRQEMVGDAAMALSPIPIVGEIADNVASAAIAGSELLMGNVGDAAMTAGFGFLPFGIGARKAAKAAGNAVDTAASIGRSADGMELGRRQMQNQYYPNGQAHPEFTKRYSAQANISSQEMYDYDMKSLDKEKAKLEELKDTMSPEEYKMYDDEISAQREAGLKGLEHAKEISMKNLPGLHDKQFERIKTDTQIREEKPELAHHLSDDPNKLGKSVVDSDGRRTSILYDEKIDDRSALYGLDAVDHGRSSTVHELTHNLGTSAIHKNYDTQELLASPYNTMPETAHDEYLQNPYETHARVNELRNAIHPDDPWAPITEEDLVNYEKNVRDDGKGIHRMLKQADKKKFADMMNKMWAAPAAVGVGVGAAATQNNEEMKTGGKARKYVPKYSVGGPPVKDPNKLPGPGNYQDEGDWAENWYQNRKIPGKVLNNGKYVDQAIDAQDNILGTTGQAMQNTTGRANQASTTVYGVTMINDEYKRTGTEAGLIGRQVYEANKNKYAPKEIVRSGLNALGIDAEDPNADRYQDTMKLRYNNDAKPDKPMTQQQLNQMKRDPAYKRSFGKMSDADALHWFNNSVSNTDVDQELYRAELGGDPPSKWIDALAKRRLGNRIQMGTGVRPNNPTDNRQQNFTPSRPAGRTSTRTSGFANDLAPDPTTGEFVHSKTEGADYPVYAHDPNELRNANAEANGFVNNWIDDSIAMGRAGLKPSDNTQIPQSKIYTDPHAYQAAKRGKGNSGSDLSAGRYNHDTDQSHVNAGLLPAPGYVASTATHEQSHDWQQDMVNNNSEAWNRSERYIGNVVGQPERGPAGYFKQPKEVHSRIMELRYQNGLKPGQKITVDDFNKMKQSSAYTDLLKVMSPDEAVMLMNNVVSADGQETPMDPTMAPEQLGQARTGGKYMIMKTGGSKDDDPKKKKKDPPKKKEDGTYDLAPNQEGVAEGPVLEYWKEKPKEEPVPTVQGYTLVPGTVYGKRTGPKENKVEMPISPQTQTLPDVVAPEPGAFPYHLFPQKDLPTIDIPGMPSVTVDPFTGGLVRPSAQPIGVSPNREVAPVATQATPSGDTKKKDQGYNSDALDWLDILPSVLGMLDASKREPEFIAPLQLETDINPRLKDVRPYLGQIQRDFNTASASLPQSPVGYANQAALFGQKYRASNQIIGQVENENNQILNTTKTQELELRNKQRLFDTDATQRGADRQLEAKAKQAEQIAKYRDAIFDNIRQKRAFNKNANLLLKLSPNFNAKGEYNGKQAEINGGTVVYDKDGKAIGMLPVSQEVTTGTDRNNRTKTKYKVPEVNVRGKRD